MLLQSGQQMLNAEHLLTAQPSSLTSSSSASSTPPVQDVNRYMEQLQENLKEGWTVHTAKEKRLYYCNHITQTAGWLPPIENWGADIELPYGWERAIDVKGQPYYINHLNKTTTYEAPERFNSNDPPPEPRLVVLHRSPTLGFGFVAGSEKPVIVRFVTEGGPSVQKLEPGDQILAVNGEDVKEAPRDHVIQLVRNCDNVVSLLVCQPHLVTCAGRKSTLLSAKKRAKLKARKTRVRFAESVCVNGAPLFPPSAFSLGDICVPPMANVLKVFLENGQTKSFKYDSTTSAQDVITSLRDKLCLSAGEHFSLVLEHVKSLKRNKLTLLDPQETVARIASRPGAHKLRCLFRISFVPTSAASLAEKDLNALDYLFMQCCNDVTQERFAPELQPDVALRLAALHMHQHALANNISPAKLTVKMIEKDFGLERFVPASLIDGMKRKELRRLVGHFLKLNSQMTGTSKMLTQLQAKIHYLDIISGLPSYGAKCFSTNQRDGVERVLLISPRFGLSQIAGIRNSVPQPIATIGELMRVSITKEDDVSHSVTVLMAPDRIISFSMEDRDASEFAIVLAGYHRLLTGKELPVEQERETSLEDVAPPFLSQHIVIAESWNYLPTDKRTHSMAFLLPPPYHSTKQILSSKPPEACDRNMNSALTANHNQHAPIDFGYDVHSVVSMEILEGHNTKALNNHVAEAKNEEVLRRVEEMQKMVEYSELYLNEHGEVPADFHLQPMRHLWRETSVDIESDCESLTSSKQSSNEENPGVLKHSDSLTLLAEVINHDLNGINTNLGSMYPAFANHVPVSAQSTPKGQRKIQGLSQILQDLHALGNDLSQSESDSESLKTPNSSPIRRNQQSVQKSKGIRTSFGLHSPDSATVFGDESKDMNLKEYLRQLKEASDQGGNENEDLAAKKLVELYGYDIAPDTIIDTDPDIIDLRALPPPQTPDELDTLNVINVPPSGFDDSRQPEGDLEAFLKKVIIEPPTQKVTPAVELTPEEILSFIIPPPPTHAGPKPDPQPKPAQIKCFSPAPSTALYPDKANNIVLCSVKPPVPKPPPKPRVHDDQLVETRKYLNNLFNKPPVAPQSHVSVANSAPIQSFVYSSFNGAKSASLNNNNNSMMANKNYEYDLYSNSTAGQQKTNGVGGHQEKSVIEYPTVERKGPFSCCTKSNKDDTSTSEDEQTPTANGSLALPPKRCLHSNQPQAPERPPKNPSLSPTKSPMHEKLVNGGFHRFDGHAPPTIPPRFTTSPPLVTPKKPPLPPVPAKPVVVTPKSPIPILKNSLTDRSNHSSPVRTAVIGSPHFYRNPNTVRDIERAFNREDFQFTLSRQNGHNRSISDCPPICLKSPGSVSKPQLSLLSSPQMSRRCSNSSIPSSPILSNKNGHTVSVDTLLAKVDVAMAGLLVKLDQIAAQCSAAQAAGGGASIDEDRFQMARDELTGHSLQLVTASKMLVMAMSDPEIHSLPEHLTTCLSALRRITELAQDLTRFTSAPLQTRNIVLKVHDVASSFRELACVQIGPQGAGQLALNAECLANVLATLLRSLRVFSP